MLTKRFGCENLELFFRIMSKSICGLLSFGLRLMVHKLFLIAYNLSVVGPILSP